MRVEPPTERFQTAVEDSDRWRHVELRPDDIVISTPPKSGTTWTQGIVRSLLWPQGDAPDRLGALSPWPDVRAIPIDDMRSLMEAATHRRFFKTHSPADAVPWCDELRYVAVYRAAPDALVSWGNHRADMLPAVVRLLNADATAHGLEPLNETWDGDYDALLEEWLVVCNPYTHLTSWWARRNRPNVLLLHYADMTEDLGREMRRLADFLDIEVPVASWDSAIERSTLEAMRESARSEGTAGAFTQGPDSFFYRGGLGRGAQLLTDDQLRRVDEAGRATLDAEAHAWLEGGSASGVAV
ncbi:MAG: sulfotransferase domain-containing protein [Actinomycetota bacterium]